MKNPLTNIIYFSRTLLMGLMLSVTISCSGSNDSPLFLESNRKPGEAEAPVKDVSPDLINTQKAFSAVAKKVTPSVVNISTISKKKIVQPFFEMNPLFEDFFGGPQFKRDKSLGSGFIISADGYIVTNDHVVRDAETIQVKLSNDKVYDAKVVGGDAKTDIAVIKITATGLPAAVLGNSDNLEVGQWAIAIGNPFGLERSMTVGVISATGRSNVGIETYENFIQTDASINPGNSGGPLLNIHGEVIGINTAIVAAGQGIGFAIPITMAKPVFTQLMNKGVVSRGYMGVTIQPITDELAQSFGLKEAKGALINQVLKDGPADKAGVRQGDVITSFNGVEVKDSAHLQRLVAEAGVGKNTSVKIIRDGKPLTLSMTLANSDSAQKHNPRESQKDYPNGSPDILGLLVEESGQGEVSINKVAKGSVAAEAGIKPGDMIVSINRQIVKTIEDYQKITSRAGKGSRLTILVRRGGASIYFALRIH